MRQRTRFESQILPSHACINVDDPLFNNPLINLSPLPLIFPTSNLNSFRQPRLFSLSKPKQDNIYNRIIFEEKDLERIISSDSDLSGSSSSENEFSVINEYSDSRLSLLSIEESLYLAVKRNTKFAVRKSMPLYQQKKKEKEKSRNRLRGLKTISQRLWIMINEMKYVSQDQMATRLLLYLNEQEFKGEEREEQNIKKRVADALNILIASGEIKKKGRKLIINQDRQVRKISALHLDEINLLRQQITKKQAILSSKKQKLREIKAKRKILNALLKRNQNNKKQRQQKILFPFIGTIKENSSIIIEKPSRDKAQIYSPEPINMFGDIDCLKWLKNDLIHPIATKHKT